MAEVFLREYDDLANLVKSVPHKEQRGFFSADVSWTCVDFTSDWVAIGTETGWLYLYDRFEESVKHRLTTKLVNLVSVVAKVISFQATESGVTYLWRSFFVAQLCYEHCE